MDESVASLLSLLDGAISEPAARLALAASHGSIDGAVRVLFEGGPLCAAAPAAPPLAVPSMPSTALIDLEDDSDGSIAPRVLVSPRVPVPRRPLPREKRPRSASPGALPRAPAVRRRVDREPPSRPGIALASRPPPPALAEAWQTAQSGAWTPFASPPPDSPAAFGGAAWIESVLGKDLPCLTLRTSQAEASSARLSDGRLHAGGCWPADGAAHSAKRPLDGAGLWEDVSWKDGQVGIRTSRLCGLFQDTLAKVRYPPGGPLECSWRITEMGARGDRRTKGGPSDLIGPLPMKPYRLLDNSGDTPAAQPRSFRSHKLRPEQLRSLAWMLAREGHRSGEDRSGADIEQGGGESSAAAAEDEAFIVDWRRYWAPDGDDAQEEDATQFVPGALVEVSPEHSGHVLHESTRETVGEVPKHPGVIVSTCSASDIAVVSFPAVEAPGCRLLCPMEDLRFVDRGDFAPGVRVCVARQVRSPAYGWGGVTPGMVGIVTKLEDEAITVRFPVHSCWKGRRSELERADGRDDKKETARRPKLLVEVRVRAPYDVRGGILADKVGYGKTATTIALMDVTRDAPAPPIPEMDRGSFIPAKGTLIILPPNLYEQWLNEISKFLCDGESMRGKFQKGWATVKSWRIFAMSNVKPLKQVKASELAEADMVICSYRLLYSPIYQERKQQLARTAGEENKSWAGLVASTRDLLVGSGAAPCGDKGRVVSSWEDLEFPLLEQFFWRRVVFDEFHELESFDSVQQSSLQYMRASYRWGLTGTPPIDGCCGAIFMSSLFRIDLPGHLLSSDASQRPNLSVWEADRLVSEAAGRFLDTFVRQNTAELPHIRLEEHVVVVRHTPEERALYLGQAHDVPDISDEAFQSEESAAALERLLKLCSHFQVGGDTLNDATEECARIGEQKDRRLVKARNQLRRCAVVIAVLEELRRRVQGAGQNGRAMPRPWRAPLDAVVAQFAERAEAAAEAPGAKAAAGAPAGAPNAAARALAALEAEERDAAAAAPELRFEALDLHRPRDVHLAALLGPPDSKRGYVQAWVGLSDLVRSLEQVDKLLQGQAEEQAQNFKEVHDASTSLDFFRRTVAALAREDSHEARSCSICFEENLPLTRLAITPCAHAFCVPCLKEVAAKLHRCSLCNRPLTERDIHPLASELPILTEQGAASSSSASASASASASEGRPNKYGTKLAALVQKLQELRQQDASAKVILFVQFEDLKRKVAEAMLLCGIPVVQLQGSVSHRAAVVRDWQHNPASETFVLLLSLSQSASGTNLTAASHVVFLHPMLAAADRGAAYEAQAIGRARRHGQRKDCVHVWRFVTEGTVEQTLTQRHQSALWRREQERDAALGARDPSPEAA